MPRLEMQGEFAAEGDQHLGPSALCSATLIKANCHCGNKDRRQPDLRQLVPGGRQPMVSSNSRTGLKEGRTEDPEGEGLGSFPSACPWQPRGVGGLPHWLQERFSPVQHTGRLGSDWRSRVPHCGFVRGLDVGLNLTFSFEKTKLKTQITPHFKITFSTHPRRGTFFCHFGDECRLDWRRPLDPPVFVPLPPSPLSV